MLDQMEGHLNNLHKLFELDVTSVMVDNILFATGMVENMVIVENNVVEVFDWLYID